MASAAVTAVASNNGDRLAQHRLDVPVQIFVAIAGFTNKRVAFPRHTFERLVINLFDPAPSLRSHDPVGSSHSTRIAAR
jgi:hypothetical protein